jgi:cullin-associated NEDD8-dissociated protein 1
MASLVDSGLTSCSGGLGDTIARPGRLCGNDVLRRATADGALQFAPSSSVPADIVDELDLLLASGRASRNTKQVITAAYKEELNATTPGFCAELGSECQTKKGASSCQANRAQCVGCDLMWCPTGPGDSAAALKVAQKLMVAAPEFHTTGRNVDARTSRAVPKAQKYLGRGFKAVVVVFLTGGADSWSLLTPHSGCKPTEFGSDLFDEYTAIRTNIALKKDGADGLLQVEHAHAGETDTADSAMHAQPCTTFGQHPKLKFLKRAYDEGDAAWVANVGALVEPTSPQQFKDKSTKLPPSIGAHNVQQRCLQNLHAQSTSAKGVLGRAMSALTAEGNNHAPYSTELFSLAGNVKFLEGGTSPPAMIDGKVGIVRYADYGKLSDSLANLTRPVSESLHAETYAQSLAAALQASEKLGAKLEATSLSGANGDKAFDDVGGLALQFKQVAKILKLQGGQDLRLERAAFVTELNGFDTHTDEGGVVSLKMEMLDASLEVLATELKEQGLWSNVTILTVSDFGRTLSSNGAGTDHGWGGNQFIMGGAIKGKRIFGQFPSSLNMDSDLIINKRGSVLPTTSWEGMWEGVLQWFGVEDKHMPTVMPNLANFAKEWRIGVRDLFVNGA